MRFLVTGATGLVGSCLVQRLVAEGKTVRIVRRSGSDSMLLEPVLDRIEIVDGDVTDAASIEEAMAGVTHVAHCAAWVGFPGRNGSARMTSVNVDGTANVVNAALAEGVTRLVHVSSVAALGRPETETNCVDETAVWTESRYNTVYGRSKYLAELEVQRGVAEGLDAVIVNPSLVFGVARRGDNTWRIVETVAEGRVYGYPAGSTHVVDVEDVVDGIMKAMEFGKTGERYVLAGPGLAWKEVLAMLAAALDRPAPSRRIGPAWMYVAGAVAETAAWLSGRTPALSRESARISARSTCFDAGRARTELGWSTRPFEDTARSLAKAWASRVALMLLTLFMTACGRSPRPEERDDANPRSIVTTFEALASIVRPIAGDRAGVVSLLDKGVSPHAFEPRASDARRVASAMAVVYGANGLDSWLTELGAPAPVALLSLVDEPPSQSGVVDPHVWLSPRAVASATSGLARHFCEQDEDGCEGYTARARTLRDSLLVLDAALRTRLSIAREDPIVLSSLFLSRFTDQYGPRVTAVVEPIEGVEPSPAHLRAAIDAALVSRAVVGQPWLPEGAARAVSEASGTPFVVVDPIGDPTRPVPYSRFLTRIADTLLEGTGHD